jgi:N-acyl-D-aspartate/D-glutamate deacylase
MAAFSFGAVLFLSLAAGGATVEADFVVRGAEIHDGSGAAGKTGDLAIRGDRIVAVGAFEAAGNPRVIDGAGLVAAPGFIDLHTHCDGAITKPPTRQNANYLMQGVTSVVTGNCGGGPVDVARFLKEVDDGPTGTNVLHLVPHGGVRGRAMRDGARRPTPAELEEMKRLVDQGMQDGAWGMSTGLIYTPGSFADTDEIVELAKVVRQHGGVYATHIRNEGDHLLDAIREALEVGKRSGAPVHIAHFKVSGPKNWNMAAHAIRLLREARQQGQIVTADQYPYIASSTSLAAMIVPAKYRSREKLTAALDDPQLGPQVRAAIQQGLDERQGGRSLVIASYAKNRSWQGKDLASLAGLQKQTPLDLVLDIQRNGGASMLHFGMSEETVRLMMQQPFVATASDGGTMGPDHSSQPHPRSYGCFPRKIGRYAIEEGVVKLPEAIRSATGLPAEILHLPKRGHLKQDCFADVVLFDPNTFRDTATFEKPHQYAAGVRYLFVNGVLAVENGRLTGALAGKALRHRSAKKAAAETRKAA